MDKDIDITRNIKVIEWLKGELLLEIANLFKVLVNGMKEEVHDSLANILANIILISYLLGKRLGISYNAIELKIKKKIKIGLVDKSDIYKYYGDLTELSRHMNSCRVQNKKE